jgi:Putative Flp pilus-assembly TadE/G-like
MRRKSRSEWGNTTFVVAGVVVAVGLLFVASLSIARAVIERSKAQSGADAVALAGAGGGRDDADRVAFSNAVQVVAWTASDRAVEVTVELIGTHQFASARAERQDDNRPVTISFWVPVE